MDYQQGFDETIMWAMNITAKLMPATVIQRRKITRAEADKKYESTRFEYDVKQNTLLDTAVDAAFDSSITKQYNLEITDYSKAKRVPQGVCKDFFETGYCRFGDACIYSHIREVDT